MKIFLQVSAALLCLASIVFLYRLDMKLTATANDLHTTEVALQRELVETKATTVDIRRTLEITGGTLNAVRDSMNKEQATITLANKKTIETMVGIDTFVAQANTLIAHIDQNQQTAFTDSHTAFEGLTYTFGQAQTSLHDLDSQINNPDIALTLSDVRQTAGSMRDSAADAKKVSDYYEKELTTPAKAWKKVMEYVLSFGADARVLFGSK